MKTVLIKSVLAGISTGESLAHPGAKLGNTPGAIIYGITGVPDDVTPQQVLRTWQQHGCPVSVSNGHCFAYDQVRQGLPLVGVAHG